MLEVVAGLHGDRAAYPCARQFSTLLDFGLAGRVAHNLIKPTKAKGLSGQSDVCAKAVALPAWKCQAVTPRTPITEYEKQTNASRHRQEKRGPLSHRSANRAHRARHCVRGFCENPAWSSALFCTMNSETGSLRITLPRHSTHRQEETPQAELPIRPRSTRSRLAHQLFARAALARRN